MSIGTALNVQRPLLPHENEDCNMGVRYASSSNMADVLTEPRVA